MKHNHKSKVYLSKFYSFCTFVSAKKKTHNKKYLCDRLYHRHHVVMVTIKCQKYFEKEKKQNEEENKSAKKKQIATVICNKLSSEQCERGVNKTYAYKYINTYKHIHKHGRMTLDCYIDFALHEPIMP